MKLQAKDLRIGNFVFGITEELSSTAMEICSLHSDNTFRFKVGKDSIGCFPTKIIDPIPLTEEWLLKFGFEKKAMVRLNDYDTFTPFILNDFEVRKCGSAYGLCSEFEIYTRYGCVFKSHASLTYFTHQIQNLYFALTGEELEIK